MMNTLLFLDQVRTAKLICSPFDNAGRIALCVNPVPPSHLADCAFALVTPVPLPAARTAELLALPPSGPWPRPSLRAASAHYAASMPTGAEPQRTWRQSAEMPAEPALVLGSR